MVQGQRGQRAHGARDTRLPCAEWGTPGSLTEPRATLLPGSRVIVSITFHIEESRREGSPRDAPSRPYRRIWMHGARVLSIPVLESRRKTDLGQQRFSFRAAGVGSTGGFGASRLRP